MDYERFELTNGLRILIAPMPAMRSVTVAVLLGVGSRWETEQESGAAHFIEHLCFKGTPTRPSSRAISETLECVGGILNAATDKEATVYWTKTASEHINISLELLADMLMNSRMTPTDVNRERSIIVEELGMSMDDPQELVHLMIEEAMWPNHQLGRDVAGTKESVQAMKRVDLRAFAAKHYGASNAIVTIAGGVNPAKIAKMARAQFKDWKPVVTSSYSPAPAFEHAGGYHLRDRDSEQLHLCLSYPGISREHPDRYALDIAATILGGSTTSRLFLEVRERLGLAYDVHVYTSRMADTGAVTIYAGVDPGRAGEAIDAILREIDRMSRRAVQDYELHKTIEYMKGRMFLGLEDTHAVASWLGSQELLLGRIESPEAVVKNVERVTAQDVRRVVRELLAPGRVRVAAIGPDASRLAESVG